MSCEAAVGLAESEPGFAAVIGDAPGLARRQVGRLPRRLVQCPEGRLVAAGFDVEAPDLGDGRRAIGADADFLPAAARHVVACGALAHLGAASRPLAGERGIRLLNLGNRAQELHRCAGDVAAPRMHAGDLARDARQLRDDAVAERQIAGLLKRGQRRLRQFTAILDDATGDQIANAVLAGCVGKVGQRLQTRPQFRRRRDRVDGLFDFRQQIGVRHPSPPSIKKSRPPRQPLCNHVAGVGKPRARSAGSRGMSAVIAFGRLLALYLGPQAGVVQWQNGSFPSCIRGFDSLHPLQITSAAVAARDAASSPICAAGRRAG